VGSAWIVAVQDRLSDVLRPRKPRHRRPRWSKPRARRDWTTCVCRCFQRRRWRLTSDRSLSRATSVFFKASRQMAQEAAHRRGVGPDAPLRRKPVAQVLKRNIKLVVTSRLQKRLMRRQHMGLNPPIWAGVREPVNSTRFTQLIAAFRLLQTALQRPAGSSPRQAPRQSPAPEILRIRNPVLTSSSQHLNKNDSDWRTPRFKLTRERSSTLGRVTSSAHVAMLERTSDK
jgi:hypothetical protein